ncbi:10104_t:CDS:2 [Entrophospora sp. SA101]|nr:10104_t:CDS:2 [Entrophospora sp. SA101]
MTTSGVNLGWSLPNSVSPSRLLQASNSLSEANRKYNKEKIKNNGSIKQVRVGPLFKLKLYYMFTASVRPKSVADFTWKEEYTKCDVAVYRICADDNNINRKKKKKKLEYVYELVLIEDLNDGRYHDEFDIEDPKKQKEIKSKLEKPNVSIPGKIKRIPVTSISRLFYNSSGSLLNIEESKSPVLVLKVMKSLSSSKSSKSNLNNNYDKEEEELVGLGNNKSTSLKISTKQISSSKRLPINDKNDSDSTISGDEVDEGIEIEKEKMINKKIENKNTTSNTYNDDDDIDDDNETMVSNINTLSVLEYILRLSALEVSEQTNHLEVADEKINLFLKDDESSGGGGSAAASSTTVEPSSPTKPTSQSSSNVIGVDSPLVNQMMNLKING